MGSGKSEPLTGSAANVPQDLKLVAHAESPRTGLHGAGLSTTGRKATLAQDSCASSVSPCSPVDARTAWKLRRPCRVTKTQE